MNNTNHIKSQRGSAWPLGFSRQGDWLQFTAIFPKQEEVSLQLWEKGEKIEEIVLDSAYRTGDLYSVKIPAKGRKKIQYTYKVGDILITDPCAKKLYMEEDQPVLAGEIDNFTWQEDKKLKIPYKEMFLYRLHVRGFTRHTASGVKNKGTFLGLCEKIPYLKELGVNAVLLMPCYEFEDYLEISAADPRYVKDSEARVRNFWGYGGMPSYFLPKRGFCKNKKSPENEFRHMVNAMHDNGIEVIMEFSFAEDSNPCLITECIRYWAEVYHIDGVYFNDCAAPADVIAKDPVLSELKMFARYWDEKKLFGNKVISYHFYHKQEIDERRLANYHDGFLITARCFLKGLDGQVGDFAGVFCRNSNRVAQINYLADNNGFTLMDVVSYNQKHNEANGEMNRDGVKENYSWNCGQEGKTRKRQVLLLRERQIRNAMLMLFLSQGVPMLYAGDEFGNSQDGNNNAYCQDNKTGWVSWDQKKKNEDFFEFVKKLSAFRRQMAVLQNGKALTGEDYLALNCPDISWHGKQPWYPDFSPGSRLLGVLLNGRYAKGKDERSLYIVFNMNWEAESIDFPRVGKGQGWKLLMDTAKTEEYIRERQKKEEKKEYYIKARSIAVFVSETQKGIAETEKEEKKKTSGKRRKKL